MSPSELRTEVLKLCEAYAAAATTNHPFVLMATGEALSAKMLELIPDAVEETLMHDQTVTTV